MGGYDYENGIFLRDVWNSEDGVNWSKIVDSTPWEPSFRTQFISFNGKLWRIGGRGEGADGTTIKYYRDIWCSTDGISWTKTTDNPGWSKRLAYTVVPYNGKIWLMGGFDFIGSLHYFSDIWTSSDGINWNEETDTAPWGKRTTQGIVCNNKIWLIGGETINSCKTDVWSYNDNTNIFDPLKINSKIDLSVWFNQENNVLSINYSLKKLSNMQIDIFDSRGRKILISKNDIRNAGSHHEYLKLNKLYSNGLYIVRLQAENNTILKPIAIIK